MYKYILFLICCLMGSNLFASTYRERVYVQTDKQLYLAGELLWMKFFLMDDKGVPNSLSKIGYVELVDTDANPLLQVKVDLQGGIGEGSVELPSSLPTGYYRMIAYTRYMQNEEDTVFFEKYLAIINTFRSDSQMELDSTARLVFYDTSSVTNVSVHTDKQSYSQRSFGKVVVSGLPENIYSLGISISGSESLANTSSAPLLSWFQQLPNLSLTDFDILKMPEYEGHVVTGELKLIDGSTSVNWQNLQTFIAFPGRGIRMYGGKIEDKNVTFYTKNITGTHEIASMVSGVNQAVRIDIQSPFVTHKKKPLPPLKLNPEWKEKLEMRSAGLQILHTYMADSLDTFEPALPYFRWAPYRSYVLDEYTRFTRMEEVFIEYVQFARFRKINNKFQLSVLDEENLRYSQGNTLVLLDGVPIKDHDFMYNYNPLLVERIDVYRGQYNIGQGFFDGIVSFTTYKNDYSSWQADESTQLFDYRGPLQKRCFYVPSYEEENNNRNDHIPDYRHTLLWNPDLSTNGETSVTIPFSTSDLSGEYLVNIEGITTDGKPVYGMAKFIVKENLRE